MSLFNFSDERLQASVRSSAPTRDGSVTAAIDFLFEDEPIFTHRAVWTDAAVRLAIAKVLAEKSGTEEAAIAEDLAKLERHLASDLGFVSAAYRDEVLAERNDEPDLRFRTADEVMSEAGGQGVEWIAEPWIARGALTEIDGKVKVSGKTTFLTHLGACVLEGRPFVGENTTKTPVVFLTEQGDASFKEALRRAGLAGNDFVILSWKDTHGASWSQVVSGAVKKCEEIGASLLIVDTLPQFAGIEGDGENTSGRALEAVLPLQEAAQQHNLGVIFSRHERKSGGEVGDSGRGSSAFPGAADIVFTLRRPEGQPGQNVRIIHALSRFDETPASLAIELTASGYIARGSEKGLQMHAFRDKVLDALPRTEADAITLDQLVGITEIGRTNLQGVLELLRSENEIARVGTGHRGNPFKFWRP